MVLLNFLLYLPFVFRAAFGANVLFVTTTPSYGTQMVLQPLWKELSRSHKVTAITPNPLHDKTLTNLTEINVQFVYDLLEVKYDYSAHVAKYKDEPLRYSTFFTSVLTGLNQDVLAHPEVQRLIKDETVKFDLVVVEFTVVPTMLAFGHRFKCPTIAVTATDASISGQDAVGNPNHPALNPDLMLKFNGELTFTQRLFSTLSLLSRKVVAGLLKRVEDETVSKFFGSNYPSLGDLTERIDLFLMNVNVAFHNVRPTVPAVIHFGGEMSIRPPKELPKDVKKFLDDGEEGVVYFSLGTVIKTKMLGPELLQTILAAFSKLPYRFLMKLDLPEDFPEKPDNLMVKKWLPQQDVLRHPNVKVFVTQCGLQSIEEAIYYNVPIVGLPYFGDQFSNCLQAEQKGIGKVFDINRLDAFKLMTAVNNLIDSPIYEEKTRLISKIALDQPMSGLRKATWWIEHILRHKGAKHLKAPSLNAPFWKFYLLDVFAFVLFVIVAITLLIYFGVRKCFRLCFKRKLTDGNKPKTQ